MHYGGKYKGCVVCNDQVVIAPDDATPWFYSCSNLHHVCRQCWLHVRKYSPIKGCQYCKDPTMINGKGVELSIDPPTAMTSFEVLMMIVENTAPVCSPSRIFGFLEYLHLTQHFSYVELIFLALLKMTVDFSDVPQHRIVDDDLHFTDCEPGGDYEALVLHYSDANPTCRLKWIDNVSRDVLGKLTDEAMQLLRSNTTPYVFSEMLRFMSNRTR